MSAPRARRGPGVRLHLRHERRPADPTVSARETSRGVDATWIEPNAPHVREPSRGSFDRSGSTWTRRRRGPSALRGVRSDDARRVTGHVSRSHAACSGAALPRCHGPAPGSAAPARPLRGHGHLRCLDQSTPCRDRGGLWSHRSGTPSRMVPGLSHEYLVAARGLEHSLVRIKGKLYGEAHLIHLTWRPLWADARHASTSTIGQELQPGRAAGAAR